jgi:hypothetical protein
MNPLDSLDYLDGPRTPRLIRRDMRAAQRLQYGEQTRQLKRQQRDAGRRQKDISSWYQDYLNQVGANKTAAQGQLDQMRNAPVTPEVSSGNAQADASRASLENSWHSMLQGQQQAAVNNYGAHVDAGALMGIGSHREQSRVQDDIGNDLRALAAEKGAFRTKYLSDAINTEREYDMVGKQFGLDVRQQDHQEAVDELAASTLDPNDELTQWKLDYAKKHGHLPSTGDGNGAHLDSKGRTPSERHAQVKQHNKILEAVQNTLGAASEIHAPDKNALAQALRDGTYGRSTQDRYGFKSYTGKPVDEYLIRAAVDYVFSPDHHISKKNLKALRAKGLLKVPGDWKYHKQKTNGKPKPTLGGGPAQGTP